MSYNINIISNVNKTIDIKDLDSNFITSNITNQNINLNYTDSYIFYINPEVEDIGYTGFLEVTNSILSGYFSYIWIILLLFVFFYIIKGAKNYVK